MTLSPEMQVVVTASKGELERRDKEKLQGIIEGGVNWEIVLLLSQRHGVFPRVWQHIGSNWSEHMPAEIVARQKKLFRENFFAATALTRHLFTLLDVFQAHNLHCIPYKGPVLASYLYDDISLRSYGDLDILIARAELAQVFKVLVAQGYTPEIKVPPRQLPLYSSVEDDLAFVNDRGVCVEVHWELSGRYLHKPMGLDLVGKDAVPVKIVGRQIPVFSDEHLLIYFCLHGVKHGWDQLDLVCCVVQILLKQENLHWQYIVDTVEEYRCRRMLFVGLLLAEKLYGIKLPEDITERMMGDTKAVRLSNQLYKTNYDDDDADAPQRQQVADPRFSALRLNVRDTVVDEARYVAFLFLVPTKSEWRAVALPDFLAWGYYLMRPLRVAGAAIGRVFHKIWHDRVG